MASVVKARNNFGVEHAVRERGNRQNETQKRARSTHVKERPSGAYRRTNQNECAKCAHERRKGNKERIAGADVMMAAGEKMAEFMCEQNDEQGEGKRKARREGRWMFVEEGEVVEKLVERHGLIVRISDGKLSAGDEASAQSKKK